VATIPDTDNGELDQDLEWDRAVGPFQFIPSTWALFEAAAGGPRNPHYLPDGLEAVVWHLCPNGELDDIEAALLGYNRSQAYVDKVLRWADVYDTATAVSPIIDHALPVANVTRGPGPDQPTITGRRDVAARATGRWVRRRRATGRRRCRRRDRVPGPAAADVAQISTPLPALRRHHRLGLPGSSQGQDALWSAGLASACFLAAMAASSAWDISPMNSDFNARPKGRRGHRSSSTRCRVPVTDPSAENS
jgi:hypothetical protein